MQPIKPILDRSVIARCSRANSILMPAFIGDMYSTLLKLQVNNKIKKHHQNPTLTVLTSSNPLSFVILS